MVQGRIDVESLHQGLVDLAVFVIYLPFRYPFRRFFEGYQWAVAAFHKLIDGSDGLLEHARNPADVARIHEQSKIAAVLAVEGAHVLDDSLDHLTTLRDDGVFYLTLTHFFTNKVASAHWTKRPRYGISAFGVECLAEMHRLHITPDLAHCSPQAIADAFKVYPGPLITSHTGVYSERPTNRNLDADVLRQITRRNGLVGVTFFRQFLCKNANALGIEAVFRTINAIHRATDDSTPCIGSDFIAEFASVKGLRSMADLPRLVDYLLERYGYDLVANIMGNNVLTYMDRCGWGI